MKKEKSLTFFAMMLLTAAAVDPFPAALTPQACNANNQLDAYPSDINYCRQMDQPSADCTELCELCFNECTSVENGYTQFYVLGGNAPAQCHCSILEKAPASRPVAAAAATIIVASFAALQ